MLNVQPVLLETPSSLQQQSLENYRLFITNSPSLKCLTIQVARWNQLALLRTHLQDLTFTGPAGSPQQLNLDDLSLSFLNFDGETTMLQEIDFLKLRKLRFKSCVQEVPLLIGIADVFARGNPTLEILKFESPDHRLSSNQGEETVRAIEQLLDSFMGLKALYIDYS